MAARDLQSQYHRLSEVESATGRTGLQRRFMVRSQDCERESGALIFHTVYCDIETGEHSAPSTAEVIQSAARQHPQEQIHQQGDAALYVHQPHTHTHTERDSAIMSALCADDKNRCRLKSVPGKQGSDYINASFIDV